MKVFNYFAMIFFFFIASFSLYAEEPVSSGDLVAEIENNSGYPDLNIYIYEPGVWDSDESENGFTNALTTFTTLKDEDVYNVEDEDAGNDVDEFFKENIPAGNYDFIIVGYEDDFYEVVKIVRNIIVEGDRTTEFNIAVHMLTEDLNGN